MTDDKSAMDLPDNTDLLKTTASGLATDEQNYTDPDEYIKNYLEFCSSDAYLKYKHMCGSCPKWNTCMISADNDECPYALL